VSAGEVRPLPLQVVIACCRPEGDVSRNERLRALMADPRFDMTTLLDTVARHRVVPQVQRSLKAADIQLPPETASRLGQMAARAALRSLTLAKESLFLQSAFDRAGLEATFIKGTALAMLIHGDVGMKDSWDIDLLLRPDQIDAACACLEREGYVLQTPHGLSPAAFKRFQAIAKECVFFHAERQIYLELHWKLVDNPHELAGLDTRRTQTVPLGSGTLTTLADAELFAYLCVHGTRHGWARLKWLADVAGFLGDRSAGQIRDLRDQAVAMGAGRAPDVALHLCATLFGQSTGAGALDAAGRYLVRTALASLTYGGGHIDPPAYSRPWRMNWIGRHLIGRTRQAFLSEAAGNWAGDHDRIHIVLPRGLGFLYSVIRIPLWLWRKAGPGRTGAQP